MTGRAPQHGLFEATHFKNAHVMCPANGIDMRGELCVVDGRIAAVGAQVESPRGAKVINCKGKTLSPGIIDMQVFAADPHAAAKGGVTACLLHPRPGAELDSPSKIRAIMAGNRGQPARTIPMAAATRGLAGRELAEVGLMRDAGALAIGNGEDALGDAAVLMRLLTYAKQLDALTIQSAEEPALTQDTCATFSDQSVRLGLPAAPAFAEAMQLARDLRLVEATRARAHVPVITTAESVELIRAAKAKGLPVTCGTTPAYFSYNEIAIGDYRTFSKLRPPLRLDEDRVAVYRAVADGTIDVISSGHTPLTEEDKRLPYDQAGSGMVGMETLLPLSLTLVRDGAMGVMDMLERLIAAPARLLGLAAGRLEEGAPADLMLFDADAPWQVGEASLVSAAKNTPVDGLPVQGRALGTWLGRWS